MAFQVVDRDKRKSACKRDGLAKAQSHHHAAHEARTRRRRNPGQIAVGQARLGHGPARYAVDGLDVAAGGDLGHHAAIGCMLSGLAGDD